MKHPLALGAAAIAAVALLAGCGSTGSSSSSSTAASTPSTATQSTTAPTTTTATATGGAVIVAKPAKMGTIVAAGPKRLTVYMFEADKGGTSSCTGACAKAWPPVTTTGLPIAAGGAVSANLGTITRADGTKQVTYKGHPLYFFEKDGDAGDAYGQGVTAFGGGWYVLKPSGAKIDES